MKTRLATSCAALAAILIAPTIALAQVKPIKLAWNPSVGAAGYIIDYGTTPGNYTGSFDVGNVTTASFQPPALNQSYYFAVKAYNAAGQSQRSAPVGAWAGIISRTPSVLRGGDFDGDGKTDVFVYRGTTGEWFAAKSTGGLAYTAWGAPTLGDIPVPADYDGDGKTDVAVYRGSTGQWFLARSQAGGQVLSWGAPSLRDVPVPEDYDGDGRDDVAVYRRTTGEWFILNSSGGSRVVPWGAAGDDDTPVPGDYNGNGKADIAVYRKSTGQWFFLYDNNTSATVGWGAPSLGDVPVPADYDGDGRMDMGVYRLTSGLWIVTAVGDERIANSSLGRTSARRRACPRRLRRRPQGRHRRVPEFDRDVAHCVVRWRLPNYRLGRAVAGRYGRRRPGIRDPPPVTVRLLTVSSRDTAPVYPH